MQQKPQPAIYISQDRILANLDEIIQNLSQLEPAPIDRLIIKDQWGMHIARIKKLVGLSQLYDFLRNLYFFKIFPDTKLFNALICKMLQENLWKFANTFFQLAKNTSRIDSDTYNILLQWIKRSGYNRKIAPELLVEALEKNLANRETYNLTLQIIVEDPKVSLSALANLLNLPRLKLLNPCSFKKLSDYVTSGVANATLTEKIEFIENLINIADINKLNGCNYASILTGIYSTQHPDLKLALGIYNKAITKQDGQFNNSLLIRMQNIFSKANPGPSAPPSLAVSSTVVPQLESEAPETAQAIESSQHPTGKVSPRTGSRRQLFSQHREMFSMVKLSNIRRLRLYPRYATNSDSETHRSLAGLNLHLDPRLENMYNGILADYHMKV